LCVKPLKGGFTVRVGGVGESLGRHLAAFEFLQDEFPFGAVVGGRG
jgi:hypothetical protein